MSEPQNMAELLNAMKAACYQTRKLRASGPLTGHAIFTKMREIEDLAPRLVKAAEEMQTELIGISSGAPSAAGQCLADCDRIAAGKENA